MDLVVDVSPLIAHPKTGIGVLLENLVEALKQRPDVKLRYFALSPLRVMGMLKSKFPGIKMLPVPARWYRNALFLTQLVGFPLDFITGSLDAALSADWLCLPLKSGITTALIADTSPLVNPGWYTKEHRQWYQHRLKSIKKNADIVIAISKSTKDDLQRTTSIEKSKIIVAYPGVPRTFRKKPALAETALVKKKYGLDRPYLLFVGTKQPRKNLNRLIKAFASIEEDTRKDCNLVLVGSEGWGKKEKPKAFIKSLGYVPDRELVALYAKARGLVYPSLMEGFGFPILEAFARKVPVVTSNVSSMKEIARDAAILVDPRSVSSIRAGVRRLLTLDKQERSRFVRAGKARLKQMTFAQMAAKIIMAIGETK